MWFLSLVLFCVVQGITKAQEPICPGNMTRCQWQDWGEWGPCSRTCGEGTRTRSRGLCCRPDETFDDCVNDCGLTYDTFQSESCLFVCPTDTCRFNVINSTDITATNFKKDPAQLQQIIDLVRVNEAFCEKSCLDANTQNGFHCWGIVYTASNSSCRLFFFNQPFTINPEKVGQHLETQLLTRQCTGETKCLATAADVIFLLDSSGSIGSRNFQLVKGFVQTTVSGLDIDPNFTRVGVIRFSDDAAWQFKLDEHSTLQELLKAVDGIVYKEGGTQTSAALELLRNYEFPDNRTVPKIAIVVTDGLSRYPSLTRVLANILRQKGVLIYAVGVGNNTDAGELFDLASMPEEKFMFEYGTFEELANANISLAMEQVPCKDKPIGTGSGTGNGNGSAIVTLNCTDTVDNCDMYGRDSCTDFGPWAHSHCSLFCGFCTGPVTTPAPCVDAIDNCASFGTYICQEKSYITWVNSNCRKFCRVCKSEETTTQSTTLATTTESICIDHIDTCDGYKPTCDDPTYRGFLEARCPATCGFCKSFELITGQQVNNATCPDWKLPAECKLVKPDPDCCPLPQCPDGYIVTVEKLRE